MNMGIIFFSTTWYHHLRINPSMSHNLGAYAKLRARPRRVSRGRGIAVTAPLHRLSDPAPCLRRSVAELCFPRPEEAEGSSLRPAPVVVIAEPVSN